MTLCPHCNGPHPPHLCLQHAIDTTQLMLGYCQLCREKEMELYDTLAVNLDLHCAACEAAGCGHPPYYIISKES